MIFGMTPFVFVHVLISLIGIASGFVVLFGMLSGKRMDGLTSIFLLFTVLTSVPDSCSRLTSSCPVTQ